MEQQGRGLEGKRWLCVGPGTYPAKLKCCRQAGDRVSSDLLRNFSDCNAEDGFESNKNGEDSYVGKEW